MKTIYKSIANLSLAGLLVLALVSSADAQRMRGGFRGGFGGGFRGGFGGVRAYPHVSVGIGIGAGAGLGYYYRPWGYPSLGIRLGVLPYGYYPFYWGPNQYYYYGGTFYAPYGSGYQVVTPPLGAEVPDLPKGSRAISIDGQQFYEFNGVYYKQAVNPDGKTVYVVAGRDGVLNTNGDQVGPDSQQQDSTAVDQQAVQPMPQVGDMTDQLPEGSRKISLNGKKFYVTPDDIYLEEVKNGSKTSYRVVSVPEPEDQNDDQNRPAAPAPPTNQGGTNL